MALARDQIVSAIATRMRDLTEMDVPEWGGSIYLRRLTVADVEATGLAEDKRDRATIVAVLALSLCDDEGHTLFDGDSSPLMDVDMSVMTRIFYQALKVNGLVSEDLEEAMADFETAQPGLNSSG